MTLSRRDLELGRMRELYLSAPGAAHALDDEALSASLAATLEAKPKGAGWWIFGYGSLLWNPIFPIAESRPALVHGLHRRFCLRSLASRGTRERPGLVLALEPGGSCKGVVFRLPSPLALDELHLLWRREMVVGSYRPLWVRARSGDRPIVALAFAVRRDHPQYAALSLDEQADTIADACGAFGSSCEYLMKTREALAAHGVADRYLDTLASAVTKRQRTTSRR
jgi:cation transport protein ChaC